MPTIPFPLPDGALSVYDALADVDAYASARGNADWAAAGEAQATAGTRAADWLNGLLWIGARAEKDQKDAWPRAGVKDAEGFTWNADEIPQAVLDAFCEMCLVFLRVGAGGMDDPMLPVSERERVSTSEKIDALSFSYSDEFATPLTRTSATGFPAVDGLIAGFLKNGSKYGPVEVHRG